MRRPATSRAALPLLVSGIHGEDPLGRSLEQAFGAAVRFLPDPVLHVLDGEARVRLAVGVYAAGAQEEQRAFAAWAQRAGVPALSVVLGPGEALIGPLALPGRAGCGRCAAERMLAAAAWETDGSAPAGTPETLEETAIAASPVLVREVRAILRRGLRRSRLVDHVLALDTATRDLTLHRIIPLARCTVCGGAAAFPAAGSAASPLSPDDPVEEVLAALAGWVDPRTGVISRLVVEPNGPGVELPLIATAAPPHVVGPDGGLVCLPIGWGKGLNLSGAILSAVGEAIERYAPSLPDPARIRWERPADLDGDVLDPRVFALYSAAQYGRDGFPYTPFDPEVRHPWVRGNWLESGEPVWVPAILTFLSFDLWQEHLFCQGTSNGLAAGGTLEDAGLRATLELIERDAFMTAWLAGCPGRRVALDDDPLLLELLAGVEALGPAAVEIYLLPTSACGTTALCLALGDGERYPGVTLGLGTDLTPRAAVRQALLELGQTAPHLRRMMRSNGWPTPAGADLVREMSDHAAYYFPADRAAAFDRLRSDGPAVSLGALDDLEAPDRGGPNPLRSLATCAAALGAAGIRVALVDVTSPDVATGPFRVVRAVSPDLQPISFGYGLDRQPVGRLRARGLAADLPAVHPIW